MKINTALILCAGFGKRLNPITLKIPKPLIKINEITLLENSINFLEKLEIKNIKINTFYLHKKISDFLLNYKSNAKIEILNDGDEILDTGGGIMNLINKSNEKFESAKKILRFILGYLNSKKFNTIIFNLIKPRDCILVKGSRHMKMEIIVKKLLHNFKGK